jgi:hypothetical protein
MSSVLCIIKTATSNRAQNYHNTGAAVHMLWPFAISNERRAGQHCHRKLVLTDNITVKWMAISR